MAKTMPEGNRWQPGKSGNQSGLTAREHRIKHMVLGLGMKAGKRLEQLIDSEDESIALGACKEVLARAVPTPKAQNNLTIVDLSGAHLEALRRLTGRQDDDEEGRRPALARAIDVEDLSADD